MQALILAAGEGKRIKPIVTSKPFLPFGGKTLLDWIISDLHKIKIKQIQIVVNQEDAALTSYPTIIQAQPTGMAGAVLAAQNKLSGPVVIVNGDDLLDPQIFQAFSQTIERQGKQICLTGLKVKDYFPGGYFVLKNDLITGIKEKPGAKNLPSPYLNLVLHYFPEIQAFIRCLKAVRSAKDDVYEQALSCLLQQRPAVLVKAKGYFQPLKYPWQILDMTKLFLTKRVKLGIDKTAKIFPGAHVVNSYIGPQVTLGHHVLVRDSIIESGTTVGYHTEICRSYVGPNNNFHTNYVGDSVIEGNSNLGAGAKLANLRFDKKEVIPGRLKLGAIMAQGSQLGINASVMPGVTLGAKAICASGLVLKENLKANEFKKS